MSQFVATVSREEGKWLATVAGLEGAHTWARNLPSLEASVREVISLTLDQSPAEESLTEVSFVYRLEELNVGTALEVGADRRALDVEESRVNAATPAAMVTLLRAGLSVRDVAHVFGVSAGRVSQIAKLAAPKPVTAPAKRA